MTQFTRTQKNRIRCLPKRAHYERETIYRILDELSPIRDELFTQDVPAPEYVTQYSRRRVSKSS